METLLQTEKTVASDVHILCTSISTPHDVNKVAWYFDGNRTILRWSIDLQDWEKVLKLVVTQGFELDELQRFLSSKGFAVSAMSD